MKNTVYKIKIEKFLEHNKNLKKGHTHFMVSKRLFNDQKIAQLKPTEVVLYLYCLSICADMMSNEFTISAQSVPKYLRISERSLSNHLGRLESFQLLTAEKNEAFINRIEKNRIEKNRIEKNIAQPLLIEENDAQQKTKTALVLASPKTGKNNELIKFYCEQWKTRYGSNPPIRGKEAGQLKTLQKDLGPEKSFKYIEAYLNMADSWFLTKRHDVGCLLTNLNKVEHYLSTGKLITQKEIKNFEKDLSFQNMHDAVERGDA